MTPTKRGIAARVRWWQHRLGLSHWTIKIEYGPSEDGSHAACVAEPEYLIATLYFDLPKIPPQLIEHYVVHELLHALVWPLANAAQALARGDKSKEEWVRTEEEGLVTTLETLIVGWQPVRPKRG